MFIEVQAYFGNLNPGDALKYTKIFQLKSKIKPILTKNWVGVPYTVRSFIIYDNDVTLTLT